MKCETCGIDLRSKDVEEIRVTFDSYIKKLYDIEIQEYKAVFLCKKCYDQYIRSI